MILVPVAVVKNISTAACKKLNNWIRLPVARYGLLLIFSLGENYEVLAALGALGSAHSIAFNAGR